MQNDELIVLEEVKYPVSISQIDAFLQEWKEVPKLDPLSEDKEPYKLVKKAHLQAVKFRTSIENKRKQLKAPALAYGKQVDSIAKEFQEMINPKELELFAERNKVEQYEKEQEQLRIDAERERVENIDKAINKLRLVPLESMGKKSSELVEIYEAIEIPSEVIYSERLDEAMIVYKDTLNKLENAIDTAKKAEQAEKIQEEAEKNRLKEEKILADKRKAEQEEFEAQKREFEAQKEEQERIIREQQEEINRQKAEREAEELEKYQEANRQKAERESEEERIKREKEDIKIQREKMSYTLDEMSKYSSQPELLSAIIAGKIPNVRWEV